MAQIASALFFGMLFVGLGAALQRLIADHLNEVTAALFGIRPRPVVREFRVTVRPRPASAAGSLRANA